MTKLSATESISVQRMTKCSAKESINCGLGSEGMNQSKIV